MRITLIKRLIRVALPLQLAGIVLFAGHAGAASIALTNFSFESPVLAPGGTTPNGTCPVGWTCNASFTGGEYYPGTAQFPIGSNGLSGGKIVPDGNQVAYVPNSSSAATAIGQTTAALIANNTTYTLDVWAGRRFDLVGPWPGATIELYAGTSATPIATLVLTDPGKGQWKDYVLTYVAGAADIHAGQALGVSLKHPGTTDALEQVLWDDVTLNSTPVPEPITMFLGGTGILILGFAARRRLLSR